MGPGSGIFRGSPDLALLMRNPYFLVCSRLLSIISRPGGIQDPAKVEQRSENLTDAPEYKHLLWRIDYKLKDMAPRVRKRLD